MLPATWKNKTVGEYFHIFSPDLLHPSQLSLLLGLGNFEHQIGRDALEHHLEGEDEDPKLDDNEW